MQIEILFISGIEVSLNMPFNKRRTRQNKTKLAKLEIAKISPFLNLDVETKTSVYQIIKYLSNREIEFKKKRGKENAGFIPLRNYGDDMW